MPRVFQSQRSGASRPVGHGYEATAGLVNSNPEGGSAGVLAYFRYDLGGVGNRKGAEDVVRLRRRDAPCISISAERREPPGPTPACCRKERRLVC